MRGMALSSYMIFFFKDRIVGIAIFNKYEYWKLFLSII